MRAWVPRTFQRADVFCMRRSADAAHPSRLVACHLMAPLACRRRPLCCRSEEFELKALLHVKRATDGERAKQKVRPRGTSYAASIAAWRCSRRVIDSKQAWVGAGQEAAACALSRPCGLPPRPAHVSPDCSPAPFPAAQVELISMSTDGWETCAPLVRKIIRCEDLRLEPGWSQQVRPGRRVNVWQRRQQPRAQAGKGPCANRASGWGQPCFGRCK